MPCRLKPAATPLPQPAPLPEPLGWIAEALDRLRRGNEDSVAARAVVSPQGMDHRQALSHQQSRTLSLIDSMILLRRGSLVYAAPPSPIVIWYGG